MWEIEKHLQQDEKIEYQGGPVWAGYWILFLLALLLIWTIIIPILIVVFIVMHKESSKFIITNKRVAARIGILSETFKSVSYKHITSMKVKQGIVGKMFNFGHVAIDTAGSGTRVEMQLGSIEDPVKIKNMIESHIE
jgi:uncharacterized membrane protein YdbT with pleckstrin-like domain